MIRKSAAAAAILVAALSAGANGAWAASLEDYYRTSMVIRACDLDVSRTKATALSRAIEQKVSNGGYSEESVGSITGTLNDERLSDEEAFCVNSQPVVEAVLDEF
jgi:hypothetical protein